MSLVRIHFILRLTLTCSGNLRTVNWDGTIPSIQFPGTVPFRAPQVISSLVGTSDKVCNSPGPQSLPNIHFTYTYYTHLPPKHKVLGTILNTPIDVDHLFVRATNYNVNTSILYAVVDREPNWTFLSYNTKHYENNAHSEHYPFVLCRRTIALSCSSHHKKSPLGLAVSDSESEPSLIFQLVWKVTVQTSLTILLVDPHSLWLKQRELLWITNILSSLALLRYDGVP